MTYTSRHVDTIKELINLGVGKAAGTLNRMLGTHVQLQVPDVSIVSKDEMRDALAGFVPGLIAGVWLPFKGPISGSVALLFPSDGASKIVSTITGDTLRVRDLDSIRAGTLSEVGNVVLNSVTGTIANIAEERLIYSVPIYMEGSLDHLFDASPPQTGHVYVVARVKFVLEKLMVEGDIVLCLDVDSFDRLLDIVGKCEHSIS